MRRRNHIERVLDDARVVVLQPGDLVVIETSMPMTTGTADLVKSAFMRCGIPHDVLVLSDGARVGALRNAARSST